ncbi:MAG: outer membrane lipoprotein-sorting protein, partial [Bacteroidetes bacterium]|nr:outer membrane lipoprotein-sorting protein [Bacteroidota bacterium]
MRFTVKLNPTKYTFFIATLSVIVSLSFTAFYSPNPDPAEIIRMSEQRAVGESSTAEITMKIIRPDWTREITMKLWSKNTRYALILITSPARDKGVAFLKRDKEVWNWQPTIDRVIKLPPSMMMQSWMGSDFTNDDLVRESSLITDYTYKFLGDSTLEDRSCYKIELIPKEDAAVVWGKLMMWIDKTDYLQLRTEFYDEDGYLVNIMKASSIKELGGRLLPSRMKMIPVDDKGQKTVIEYK